MKNKKMHILEDMLYDTLKEQLKEAQPALETIAIFWKNAALKDRLDLLEKEASQESFWQNPKQAEISRELQKVRDIYARYQRLLQIQKELGELVSLFENEEQELQKITSEVTRFLKDVEAFKIELLLADPKSDTNCFLSINSGAGGTESQDWANMLLRMYVRFCEREHFGVQTIDYQPGEEAGIKSATLLVKGKNAYGLLKNEQGVHRLVRISPFDANKRRHTSFAAVAATPEVADVEIAIKPEELRIDTYRSSGAGGQHVNTTDSAVRITHLPTGIVVQCQNERSQTQNKETAMKMLKAKLAQRREEEREAALKSVEKKKIEWGSQIRSYVLHPYKMVKDHRTDFESPQPDLVLDGEIMPFIEANLLRSNT